MPLPDDHRYHIAGTRLLPDQALLPASTCCLQQPELVEGALQGGQLLRALLSCMQRCKADLPVAAAAQCLKVLLQLGGPQVVKGLVDAGGGCSGVPLTVSWHCWAISCTGIWTRVSHVVRFAGRRALLQGQYYA